MWRMAGRAGFALAAAVALAAGTAMGAGAPFPDVPPWHWAHDSVTKLGGAGIVIGYPASPQELVATSITDVYDAFAHASAPEAQSWAERFTYDRPATWPAPLTRSAVAAFSLTRIRPVVTGTTALATYDATVTLRNGRRITGPMRVQLRLTGDDWQVDYATLAGGSSLFR